MKHKKNKERVYDKASRLALLCLYRNDNCTLTNVGKITDLTHSHVIQVLYNLKSLRYVEITDKIGRHKIVTLTKKGLKLAMLYEQIEEVVG